MTLEDVPKTDIELKIEDLYKRLHYLEICVVMICITMWVVMLLKG